MSRPSHLVDNWTENLKLRAEHGNDTQLLAYSTTEIIRVGSPLNSVQNKRIKGTRGGCYENPSTEGHEYREKAQEAGRRIILGAQGDMKVLLWKTR